MRAPTLALIAAIAAGLVAWLVVPAHVPIEAVRERRGSRGRVPLSQGRLLLSGAAALAGWAWLPGRLGLVASVALAVGTWIALGRRQPAAVRRAREQAEGQLPTLVTLLAAALRAGAAPGTALDLVCTALPGAAADRLGELRARLRLGVDPVSAWRVLDDDEVLAPLGRCLARAHRSGAPVADAVAGLAHELAEGRRASAEERARSVGVKAAVPLGLCLLPAFIALGIVPVVATLLASVTGG